MEINEKKLKEAMSQKESDSYKLNFEKENLY